MINRENENKIIIDFGSDVDFDELVEQMFWEDLYFEVSDMDGGAYIHDTNQRKWYAVENKYWYANFNSIVKSADTITFDMVDDELTKELNEECGNIFSTKFLK